MPDPRDHYQIYYQDKLWNLLPGLYRALDTASFTTPGPLREIVNRIGAQAAILRRSIDRLWEDQSIETCDDWVIAYIADLLATNLVASLDARGQRLDVANTIYYRRRKGTVSILEEIAADITGWDARAVEFFRRLGRTRHNFDPEINIPTETDNPSGELALQLEEGIRGFWTHTGIGGWADLRNRYGATKSASAFDEYFHTADFRLGVDMVGWHNIPRLGVFLWRLFSFGVDQSMPIEMTNCPGQFTFDPTGRQIKLLAAASRTRSASYGDQWVSPNEWQLPGPIATPLLEAALRDPATIPLYSSIDPSDGITILPNSLGVFTKTASGYVLLDLSHFLDVNKRSTIFPEIGRFRPVGSVNLNGTIKFTALEPTDQTKMTVNIDNIPAATPNVADITVTFGAQQEVFPKVTLDTAKPDFLETRINNVSALVKVSPGSVYPASFAKETDSINLPAPGQSLFVTYHYGFSSTIGAGPFDRRIPGVPATPSPAPVVTIKDSAPVNVQTPTGTTTIQDSLTYATVNNAAGIFNSRVEAAAQRRPVLRLPAPSPAVSEWVLTGSGDQSQLSLEGLLISGGDIILRGAFASVTLTCCTLDPGNEGDATTFAQSVDLRDLRPTRLFIEADIAQLTIDRSICGPIRVRGKGSVISFTVIDSIIQGLRTGAPGVFTGDDIDDPIGLALVLRDPSKLSTFLRGLIDAPTQAALAAWDGQSPPDATFFNGLLAGLNAAVNGPSIYDPDRFNDIPLSPETLVLLALNPTGADLVRLNRLLLEEAFPEAIGQPAVALATGNASLSRCTVLGRLFVHRLQASECILDDFTEVEDTQHGCVRFSAWSTGSVLPRQFESVQVPPRAALFVSRQFAEPGYAQLLPTVDRAAIAPTGATILQGAEDGSEMGAFAREKSAIKERSLLIKYQEFMPLGLVPVVAHVT